MNSNDFKIDKYTWSTREEYEIIMDDIQSIKRLLSQVNCNDPKTALKIINSLKSRPTMFKSRAGIEFKECLEIIIASDSLKKNHI